MKILVSQRYRKFFLELIVEDAVIPVAPDSQEHVLKPIH
ncbi:hypothetical protein EVA_11253 [gut metagenome]|uniref:Uncharacterized protein n=1 Tax=gut metagenome TaxID=749906 RepID=J9G1C9_9ZZZZ